VKRVSRIGPYLYALTRSYSSIGQVLLTPLESRTAQRDAALLRQRFPVLGLGDYANLAEVARAQLLPAYEEYTRTVSPALITVALELSAFLTVICERLRPRTILDLGSGFSSYVFRRYARQMTPEGQPVVHSVDESRPWLEKTHAFLRRYHLEDSNLSTWSELQAAHAPPFDLVLYDLATLELRVKLLPEVLKCCRAGGLMVIDDMHVPGYRRAIRRILDRAGTPNFSLRAFTRKRLRYAYLVTP
jgi:predicted O-methyltransferase YrrM